MTSNKKRIYTTVDKDGSLKKAVIIESVSEEKEQYIPKEYFNLGMYFLVPLILGLSVGKWLDARYNKDNLFTLLFLSLGILSVFYNLISLIKKR